jgi:N-acetyl-gamma-glutamyl-phosphate reductase
MIRVGIVGATGYTALELIRILLRHPDVTITRLTAREGSARIAEIHPTLETRLELPVCQFQCGDFSRNVDFAFSCLPHAASAAIVRQLADAGIRTIDLSADYRLDDWQSFEQWYQVEHPDRARLGKVPYGIPELFADQILDAPLVANPGCFATSAIIPLAPLLRERLIQPSPIIIDSKTGISGAGRKPDLRFHFPECNESVSPYSVGSHRHTPEIEQVLGRFANCQCRPVFTPHLVPMDRGILSTIYVRPSDDVDVNQLTNCLANFYEGQPFIRISSDRLPKTKDVCGTNFCDIGIRQNRDAVLLISAIDNLVKGASGGAVQNFNIMQRLRQTTALE